MTFKIKKTLRKMRLCLLVMRERLHPVAQLRHIRYHCYKSHYRALAAKDKVIWINTEDIQKALLDEKIKKYGFEPVMDGDWDLNTRPIISDKILGIEEHYRQGISWEETRLFRWYAKRFEKELLILRCKNIEELKLKYETYIETLYQKIKAEGFLTPCAEHPDIDVIEGYIDRKGHFIFGSNGNHRLAFARILGIEKIPVKIKSRHQAWQDLRETIVKEGPSEAHRDHPDLQDLFNAHH